MRTHHSLDGESEGETCQGVVCRGKGAPEAEHKEGTLLALLGGLLVIEIRTSRCPAKHILGLAWVISLCCTRKRVHRPCAMVWKWLHWIDRKCGVRAAGAVAKAQR